MIFINHHVRETPNIGLNQSNFSVVGFCPSDNAEITSRELYQENFPNENAEKLIEIAKTSPLDLDWGDWEKVLTRNEFQVTRLKCNENPFSSPLNEVSGVGIFECVNCGKKLFESKTKYNSGYGWPAFYHPINLDAVVNNTDKCHPPPGWYPRFPVEEITCAKCGAHLGHRFTTSPRPDGLRYFINGIALHFNQFF